MRATVDKTPRFTKSHFTDHGLRFARSFETTVPEESEDSHNSSSSVTFDLTGLIEAEMPHLDLSSVNESSDCGTFERLLDEIEESTNVSEMSYLDGKYLS